MKRLMFAALCVLLCALLVSCTCSHTLPMTWSSDSDSHRKACSECGEILICAAHTYVPQSVNGDGREVLICSVCSYTTLAHSYSEEWTSDSLSHWHACIDDDCHTYSGKAEHSFGEPTVITAPTSEADGSAIRVCSVCGRGAVEPIAKLPPKMSRAEWISAFAFENVMMDHTASVGMFGTVKSTVLVDGDHAESITDGESTYASSGDVIESLDFAPYYDSFVHIGDDVYVASELSFEQGGVFYTYQDCEIAFEDGRIARIYYSVDFGNLFGTVSEEYILYGWGEVVINVPTVTNAELASAISADRFLGNFSLIYEIYSDDSYEIAEIKVINDIYTYEKRGGVLDEVILASGYCSSEGLAQQISDALSSVLGHIDASALVYDSIFGYVLAEPIENFAGTGKTLSELAIVIEDGYLMQFSYLMLEDGVTVSYTFEDYAEVNGTEAEG